jgi:hypothetical protein
VRARPGPDLWEKLADHRKHVVRWDLRELRPGCLRGFRAELERWCAVDELPAAAEAILALLCTLPRQGLQLSVEALARIIGWSERQTHYALDRLQAQGFVRRFRRLHSVEPWTDARGRTHTRADGYAATFLTDAARRRLGERGWWREWNGAQQRRIRRRAGVLGFLGRKLGMALRKCSRRFAGVAKDCTPSGTLSESLNPQFLIHVSHRGRSACGKGAVRAPPGARFRGPTPHPFAEQLERLEALARAQQRRQRSGVRPRREGGGSRAVLTELDELVERCWSHHVRVRGRLMHSPITHARDLWPDRWRDQPSFRDELVGAFADVRREIGRRVAAGEVCRCSHCQGVRRAV